jgi:transcriptional regulator with XRE-family HTH domain
MPDLKDILKKAREKKGLSQQEVADFIGVSQKAYSMYEEGKRNPKHDKRVKLSKLFGLELSSTNKEPEVEGPSESTGQKEPAQETQQSIIDKMMKFIVLLMEKQNGLVETQTVVMNRQNTILEKNQEFVIEKIENISLTVEAIRQNHEKMIIEIKTSSNGIEGKFQVFEKTIVEKFSTLSQLVKDESRMGFHQQYEEKDKRNQTGNAGKRHKRGS